MVDLVGVEPTSEKFIHGPFAESLCFPSRAGFPCLSKVSHCLLPRMAWVPAGCIGAQCWKRRRYDLPRFPRTREIRQEQGELSLAHDARAHEVPGLSIKPRERRERKRWCCWRLNFAPPVSRWPHFCANFRNSSPSKPVRPKSPVYPREHGKGRSGIRRPPPVGFPTSEV